MNYKSFKNKENIDLKILTRLGILQDVTRIIQVSHSPDYDLSRYGGSSEKSYIFKDSWSFGEIYSAIINVSIDHDSVFCFDDVVRLSKEYGVEFDDEKKSDLALNAIRGKYPDLMLYEGTPTDFDGFKLNEIKVDSVDNFSKELHFLGGFDGDSFSIEPMDWNIVVECSFKGFLSGEKLGGFYPDLIAESFSLREVGNIKLSYFLAYSAFESYINERLGSHDQAGRIKQKLNELFKKRFDLLVNNQIYSSINNELDHWESIRNHIAHGRNNIELTEQDVYGLTLFALTLIAAYETRIETFDSLFLDISK